MDAKLLVERRKDGSISQEEFFIALNQLRRANIDNNDSSGLAGRRSSLFTQTEPPPCRETNEVAVVNPLKHCLDSAPVGVASNANDGVDKPIDNDPGSISQLANAKNDTQQEFEPYHVDQERAPSVSQDVDPDSSVYQSSGDSRRKIQLNLERDSVHLPTEGELNSSVPFSSRALNINAIKTKEQLKVEQIKVRHELDEEYQNDDYEWLISPKGETTQLHHRTRKSRVRNNHNRDWEDATGKDSVQSAAAILSRKSADVGTVGSSSGKPHRRPTSGSPEQNWERHVSRLYSPPIPSSSSPGLSPKTTPIYANVRSMDKKKKKKYRVHRNSFPSQAQQQEHQQHQQLRQQRSEGRRQSLPSSSCLVEVGQQVLQPNFSRRRERGTQESKASFAADGVISKTSAGLGLGAKRGIRPGASRGVLNDSCQGGEGSARSLSSGILWRSRSRHREEYGPATESRRLSGSTINSVGSLSLDRYYTVARRDRLGYPLHEREGLESSNVEGDNNMVFSPMIKGLPDFYKSRPKRTLDSFERGVTRPELGESSSIYERTTDWLIKADKLRACKLARREEQELKACTFQPNARRRRPNTPSCASTSEGWHPNSRRIGDDGVGVDVGGSSVVVDSKIEEISQICASSRASAQTGLRLFEESKRLRERRFERTERKNMAEEEIYARTCTFQPSLAKGPGASTIRVRARYRDKTTRAVSASPPPEPFSFRPQIIGVQPGMTRAIEYVSSEVSERLYRQAHSIKQKPPEEKLSGRALEEGGGDEGKSCTVAASTEDFCEGERRHHRLWHSVEREEWSKGGRGVAVMSSQSEGHRDRKRRFDQPCYDHRRDSSTPGGSFDRNTGRPHYSYQGSRYRERRRSEGYRGRPWEEIDRSLLTATRKGKISGRHQISSRPRSAPTAAGRESGGNDRDRQRQHPEEGRLEQTFDGMEDKKEGVGRSRNRRARWTAGGGREDWCSRGDGGSGGDVGMGPRRQVSMSFRDFLARQNLNQATARQRLSRLNDLHSPSFTPQLSRGSRRIVARNEAPAGRGGGRFKDRLNMTTKRRQRGRKAAALAARELEVKMCTFSPQLTPRARAARSRSVRELSLGDSVLRATKQRMARAREEIRMMGDLGGFDGRFIPTFETAGNGFAPPAPSKLGLADGLDTYLDRVQEAAMDRDENHFQQRRRQLFEESRSCTFRPEIRGCPDLVKRTAAGMRCIREFRCREALLSGNCPSPKPDWR